MATRTSATSRPAVASRRATAPAQAAAPAARAAVPAARAAAAPAAAPARRTAPAAAPARGRGPNAGNTQAAAEAALAKILRTAGQKWADNKEEAKKDFASGTNMPPGTWETRLQEAKVVVTKGPPQEVQVIYIFTGTEGDALGKRAEIWQDFTDEGIIFHMKTLRRLGMDLDDVLPEELPEKLPAFIHQLNAEKPAVEVYVAANEGKGKNAGKTFYNAYANKILDMGAGGLESQLQTDAGTPDDGGDGGDGGGDEIFEGQDVTGEAGADAGDAGDGSDGGAEDQGVQVSDAVRWKEGRKTLTGIVRAVSEDGAILTVRDDESKTNKTVDLNVNTTVEILAD